MRAGVEVDIPASLAGIQFAFKDGALTIQCANFTGNVVLNKSGAYSVPAVGSGVSSTLIIVLLLFAQHQLPLPR